MNIKKWLREKGYGPIADLIDVVEKEIADSGSKQRRNWWDVLAGAKDGKPIVVNGQEFPVLRAAQIRQQKPVTDNAISLDFDEEIPGFRADGRWPKKKRLPARTRTKAVAKKPSRPVQARAS